MRGTKAKRLRRQALIEIEKRRANSGFRTLDIPSPRQRYRQMKKENSRGGS